MSPERLAAIGRVLEQMAEGHDDPPRVTTTTDLDEAVGGAEFVFSAIRVGGLEAALPRARRPRPRPARPGDHRPGRTVLRPAHGPVALHVAERVRALAPGAWVINFTNPAGLITEAMQSVLGDRVVGICDSPIGLAAGPRPPSASTRHRRPSTTSA